MTYLFIQGCNKRRNAPGSGILSLRRMGMAFAGAGCEAGGSDSIGESSNAWELTGDTSGEGVGDHLGKQIKVFGNAELAFRFLALVFFLAALAAGRDPQGEGGGDERQGGPHLGRQAIIDGGITTPEAAGTGTGT